MSDKKITLFGILLFGIMFLFFQQSYLFHFYYIEQHQLFLFSKEYFYETINTPGGLSLYINEFLIQFYLLPYAGSFITSLLLTMAGILIALICKRLAPNMPLYFLYCYMVLALMFMHFKTNYLIQGTIAYLFLLLALYGYIRMFSFKWRLVYAAICVPLLFYGGGPVSILFAICIILYEMFYPGWHKLSVLLIAVEAVLIAVWSVYWGIMGSFRLAFLPDIYLYEELSSNRVVYELWIRLPILFFIALLFRNRKPLTQKREVMETVLQFLIIGVACWSDIPKHGDSKSVKMKELDYYSRNEKWDDIIEACKTPMVDYAHLGYLNRALAEKGILAEKMFLFDQHGAMGLYSANYNTTLLCDIYFTLGNMALSQEMAFETYLLSTHSGNPRMLKRLIQTNLVYGAWNVAEKYISILEKSLFYKQWAKEQRRFLFNDEAIRLDPVLGDKRKSLVCDNYLRAALDPDTDLFALARQNPDNHIPPEYAGAYYLLLRDSDKFMAMLGKLYDTNDISSLPISFQEAFVLFNTEPDKYEKYAIPQSLIREYMEFQKQSLIMQNKPSNQFFSQFGHTYWYYYTFKKSNQA
ncbi:MAG: DUF6057 family protein [Tannerellaceae bacterium]|jgi:hypothetical protein|nr:DUF6057 family protein [Tannerellaceae bacterium]